MFIIVASRNENKILTFFFFVITLRNFADGIVKQFMTVYAEIPVVQMSY